MSLLPIDVIRAFRKNIDTVISIFGITCELYLPRNVEQQDRLDIYNEAPTLQFDSPIETQVFIEWHPTMKRLRNLGIFTEDEIPIIAWLRCDHMITRNAYIKVPVNYDYGRDQTDEFELVDRLAKNAYDAIVVECWKISPRRHN